jgi:hypothetical protein
MREQHTNDELKGMWKQAVVITFKEGVPGENAGNYEYLLG